ncbi:MAG: EF-P beta-lysylation protein EpmB [Planctomycetia bacterium]|nr:EF-P beta-lysylation protein EpmB [Planctomycetia bacterium]
MPHAGPSTVIAGDRREPWQRELTAAVRDAGELRSLLGLPAAPAPAAVGEFPLLVPRGFVARMKPGDPHDPLLLQVLPVAAEDIATPGFTADPLLERDALAAPGLVRKYAGRALLLAAAGCAVNCRYCFRREFPYAESGAHRAGIAAAVETIAADATLHEVILSGGDPLLLDDDRLAELIGRLEAVPHVRRLRIHTRLPVVLPERVTDALVAMLRATRLTGVVVVHANHPAELDDAVAAGLRRLVTAGVILLNQSVLLAGVNDSPDVLAELSERLVDIGVVPYYLHLLDRVRGTAHFEVAEREALGLIDALRRRLPGYAVPRLAREVPGEAAKTWIGYHSSRTEIPGERP